MMMLYVIMMNGTLYMQTLDISNHPDQQCVIIAAEMRKNDKVSDAFCMTGSDMDGDDKFRIGRRPEDGKTAN